MGKKDQRLTVRGVPSELVEEVDKFAAETAGPGGKPSRDRAIQHLIRRGLDAGVLRGDVADTTRRGS